MGHLQTINRLVAISVIQEGNIKTRRGEGRTGGPIREAKEVRELITSSTCKSHGESGRVVPTEAYRPRKENQMFRMWKTTFREVMMKTFIVASIRGEVACFSCGQESCKARDCKFEVLTKIREYKPRRNMIEVYIKSKEELKKSH